MNQIAAILTPDTDEAPWSVVLIRTDSILDADAQARLAKANRDALIGATVTMAAASVARGNLVPARGHLSRLHYLFANPS